MANTFTSIYVSYKSKFATFNIS